MDIALVVGIVAVVAVGYILVADKVVVGGGIALVGDYTPVADIGVAVAVGYIPVADKVVVGVDIAPVGDYILVLDKRVLARPSHGQIVCAHWA